MITIAAIALSIQFSAGTTQNFVSTLAKATSRPVIVYDSGLSNCKAFEADPDDISNFARQVKGATELSQAPGVDFSFSSARISRDLIQLNEIFGERYYPDAAKAKGLTVSNGVVTVAGEFAEISLAALQVLNWKSEIGWDWMMEHYTVIVSAKELPEAEFLRNLAKAAGYQMEAKKGTISFKLIPSEFRKRALATLAKHAPSPVAKIDVYDRWRIEMTQFALTNASDNQLLKAFADSDSEVLIPMEGALKQSLGSKLLAMAKQASSLVGSSREQGGISQVKPVRESPSGGVEFRGNKKAVAGFVETVDWNRPVVLTLKSNFRTSITGFAVSNQPNNSGPTSMVVLDF